MVDTSKLSKRELKKLLHTHEVEYQELSDRLGEHSYVSGTGPRFTTGQGMLAEEAQAPSKGAQP